RGRRARLGVRRSRRPAGGAGGHGAGGRIRERDGAVQARRRQDPRRPAAVGGHGRARARLLDRRRDPRASNRLLQAGDRGGRRGGSGVPAGAARPAPVWPPRAGAPGGRLSPRRGEWPPDVRDADLVIHATPVRDEVLFELGPGQTLIDLPYPRTATAEAAAASGARVLDGLEVLVAQGAASFELWTGVEAPLDA